MRRRDFLRASLAGLTLSGLTGLSPALGAPQRGPRYIVQILLRGGMDAVYTFDPKTRSEVDAVVDVPYGPDAILQAGPLRWGPHLAGLEPYAGRMAVLRGVAVKTANHESGATQFLRLQTGVGGSLPSLLDVLGQQRGSAALASVTIGNTSSLEYSQGHFGGPTHESRSTVLDRMDGLEPEDAAVLARTYAAHVETVQGWAASPQRDQTLEHLGQVRDLFERLERVPPFAVKSWSEQSGDARLGEDLQRTLWLLEHDLTRGVYLKIFLDWDSHFANARKQTSATRAFVPAFARFLSELGQRRNAYGKLADNTLVVMGSELGRFPQLNGNEGKDHFPETTVVLMGPGVRTSEDAGGPFGETGRMMEGQRLSLRSGRPEDGGALVNLDDVGATVLHLCGMNPELYGYHGRRLSFLERA